MSAGITESLFFLHAQRRNLPWDLRRITLPRAICPWAQQRDHGEPRHPHFLAGSGLKCSSDMSCMRPSMNDRENCSKTQRGTSSSRRSSINRIMPFSSPARCATSKNIWANISHTSERRRERRESGDVCGSGQGAGRAFSYPHLLRIAIVVLDAQHLVH